MAAHPSSHVAPDLRSFHCDTVNALPLDPNVQMVFSIVRSVLQIMWEYPRATDMLLSFAYGKLEREEKPSATVGVAAQL